MQDLISKRQRLKCVFLGHLGNESILMNGRYNHFISAIMFPLTPGIQMLYIKSYISDISIKIVRGAQNINWYQKQFS